MCMATRGRRLHTAKVHYRNEACPIEASREGSARTGAPGYDRAVVPGRSARPADVRAAAPRAGHHGAARCTHCTPTLTALCTRLLAPRNCLMSPVHAGRACVRSCVCSEVTCGRCAGATRTSLHQHLLSQRCCSLRQLPAGWRPDGKAAQRCEPAPKA